MIGKVTISRSFRTCINYCLEDKKLEETQEAIFKNRAELIACNQCFGKKNELIEQFNDVRALNKNIQKPVLHIMLSLSPTEQLERGKLIEIAADCSREMGFQNNQYILVAHKDTNHQHLHIVANRVGYDGKVVSDSHNYKKIACFCRKMELKYNLHKVLSPKTYISEKQRNIPRMDQRKEKLKANVVACLSTSKNYADFEAKIKQKGYEVIKGRGISFIDKQAVKVKGSEVGFSLQRIEKILDLQQQLKQVREEKAKHEQHSKTLLPKYHQHESPPLAVTANFLAKTIELLLRPAPYEEEMPKELLEEHRQEERKKRKQHLSQHH